MKTGILWDLDGTLLDTLEDLADAVNFALCEFGYPTRSVEEVRCFVGNGARRLIERAVPENGDVSAVFDTFRTYYNAHCQIKSELLQIKKKSKKKHSSISFQVNYLCLRYFYILLLNSS